ncbi:MAG TPA: SIR2 family protein [Thermoanaerobaculia bacterium]|jgi:hypothetical protein|nr:SIR2 family protein [Thermoanaerobaculia bacterium]
MPLHPPPSLVRHLRAGRCVLFAGAGLSAWAKLPTWGELLATLVAEVRDEGAVTDAEELQTLLAANQYLQVADCCKERLGQRFYEVLRSLRGGDGPVPEPHRLALRLPFAAWVTTNYDKLLERAYTAEHGGDQPRVLTHKDSLGTLLFDGAPFILKAHGDIDRPDTVVLTARDYSALIQGNPSFNAFFSALLLTKAILFVGYSLSDPDFRLLVDRQLTLFGDQVPDRWALMSGVGPVESELLWRTARIRVLSYPAGKHEEVLGFLRALEADLTLPLPRTRGDGLSLTTFDESDPGPPRGGPKSGYALHEPEPSSSSFGAETAASPSPLPPHALTLTLARGRSGIAAVLGRTGDPPLAQGEGAPADRAELLRVLATLGSPDAAAREYAASGRALAGCLPSAVIEALAGLGGDELLVLQLEPDLETLPWELLRVGERALAVYRPLVRAPVGVSEAARGYRPLRRPARALLIGDPTEYLPGAREEIEQVAALYQKARAADSTRLFGRQATAAAVLAALDATDYDIVHFAGHAWYDAQEVYLAVAGDVHVTASDLRPALSRHPPAILVLNSHFTAFVPPGVGIERQDAVPLPPTPVGRPGFTALAARTGVGAFVGCFGSPGDASSSRLATHLHRELLGGATIAQALYRARLALAQEMPADPTGLVYVLSGASELRMLPG